MNGTIGTIKELMSNEWSTKKGGILYAIGVFILSFGAIVSLQQIGVRFGVYWSLGILSALQLGHFVAWFVRRNYFYDPELLTIAFAVATEDPSQDYYKEIKKKFKEQIDTYSLRDNLKIKELPGDISFSDSKSAERFIERKGIRLLIWGNTTEGNLQGDPFSQFNIKFSYLHRYTGKKTRKQFVEEIDIAAQRKMWGIRKPDSFHNLVVVSGNILEISLYTLGLCLATVPSISYLLKSVDILEKLSIILQKRKQDENFPNFQIVKGKTKYFLDNAYTFLLVFYWHQSRDLDKAIEYAEKAIKINENNFIAHQNMAVFQWRKNRKEPAIYHTNRAWRIRPGHPLPRFNRAFFLMYDRKYESALKEYKKIKYTGDTNILDVIEFIEKEFGKSRDNLGLLFIVAWLNIQYADQDIGAEQLQDFLRQAEHGTGYEALVSEAKRISREILPSSK